MRDIMRTTLRVPLKAQHGIGSTDATAGSKSESAGFGTTTMRPQSATLRGVARAMQGASYMGRNRPHVSPLHHLPGQQLFPDVPQLQPSEGHLRWGRAEQARPLLHRAQQALHPTHTQEQQGVQAEAVQVLHSPTPQKDASEFQRGRACAQR